MLIEAPSLLVAVALRTAFPTCLATFGAVARVSVARVSEAWLSEAREGGAREGGARESRRAGAQDSRRGEWGAGAQGAGERGERWTCSRLPFCGASWCHLIAL